MTIHKEGRTILFIMLVVLMAVNWAISTYLGPERWVENLVIAGSLILYLLVLQFFRNPVVHTTINDSFIYAPADGKVVVIEETKETEYFDEIRKQVSIFMSPINVHVNRNPMSGIIKYFKYHPGKYLVAWHPKSSTENERTSIVIQKQNGAEVLMRQIAGAMARRIKWYINQGDRVVQGAEFGFIKFGSRVDLFLPLDTEIKVNIGDKTKGGQTVVAELKG
ncbi:MAG: phosphatidylserine decarboxylase family protein [Bacteroidota bacterium]